MTDKFIINTIKLLDSRFINRRNYAKDNLDLSDAVQFDLLLGFLEHKSSVALRLLRIGVIFGTISIISILICFVFVIIFSFATDLSPFLLQIDSPLLTQLGGKILGTSLLISVICFALAIQNFSMYGIYELAKLCNSRSINLLLEAYRYFACGAKSRKAVEEALIDILPRISITEANLIDKEHRKYIHAILKNYMNNPNLAIAALKAVARIKDDNAKHLVSNIVNSQLKTHMPNQLYNVANETLKVLSVK